MPMNEEGPDSPAIPESTTEGATPGDPGINQGGERTEQSDEQRDWPDEKLTPILESLLFAAGEPVSLSQIANALEEVPRERIRKTLNQMAAAYASGGRGLVLEEIAGGYQLRTHGDHSVYVRRLLSVRPPRLSRPVLETLAIVAYRQPITRPEIEQLRGVDSGGVLDTLIERNLVKIAGRKDAPGRPLMYTTTRDFLELFGLKDLESLPDLAEFRELEGLREPGGLAPQSLSLTSPEGGESEPVPDSEVPRAGVPAEPVPESPTCPEDEVIAREEASIPPPEGVCSPADADEPASSDPNEGSEDPHS